MGTPYSTVAVSGYNSSPPSDDGTQVDSNKVYWSTAKTKLGDPLNTAIAAIDTALVAAFNYTAVEKTADYTTVAGDAGKIIEIGSTVSAAVTITLGQVASMGTSYIVKVVNRSTIAQTVVRGGSDTINGSLTSLTIPSKAALTFQTNASNNGYDVISDHGYATGNLKVDGTLNVTGSTSLAALTVSGAVIGAASQAVFNTVSTTVNAFGAATTLNIGNSGGTNTILGATTFSQALTGSSTVTGASFIPSGSSVPTNGLYLPASNQVAIAVNSAEGIRVDASGNLLVGINAASFGSRLRVKGSGTTSGTYCLQTSNSAGDELFSYTNDGAMYVGAASASPYNNTTASAANAFIASSGLLQRSTSSERFKRDIEPMSDEAMEAILSAEPIWYRSTCANDDPAWSWYGLSAEKLANIDPRFVHFRKEKGELIPDGVQYERLVVPLIGIIKKLEARISALEV